MKKPDRRVKKTLNALEDAFYELNKTKMMEDITVDELCRVTDIRRNTFYLHFNDKYDFFAYVVNNIQRRTNLSLNADPRNIRLEDITA